RLHRNAALLTLEGIADRNEAETLRGMLVSVPLNEGAPLEEGEYYVIELLGMEVYTDIGRYIGVLEDIFETGANDVYIVRGTALGDVLIPDIPQVIHQIDFEQRRIIITPLPGLLPSDPEADDASDHKQ
ncbi:MAG: 16S rRNA processing protein RimM, partial [Phototrophicales bacterium]